MLYENICKYASEKGIAIYKIEDELGFAKGSLCKWSIHQPAVGKVKAVADMLGVDINKLLEESE